jgi:cell division protein FtsB
MTAGRKAYAPVFGLPIPHPRVRVFGPAQMVIVVALLLMGLFVYAAFQTAVQSQRLQQQERALRADIAELQVRNAELTGLSEYIASDEYIESFARQKFGLVMPGETVVEVDAPPVPPAQRTPGQRWWESLFGD